MIREAWERISAKGPGWFWVANQMRNGDVYHACSLVRAFTKTHSSDLPIYFIAAGEAQLQIARLYEEFFAETLLVPELPQEPEPWRIFLKETGLPNFGPNTPILLHPRVNQATCVLDRFSAENGLNWMQLYKHILHLPANATPAAPQARPSLGEEAREFCEIKGLEQSNSVLLFPYAQSLRADGLRHFRELAAEMGARGLKVFTSLSVDEEAVPGTVPIFIPFSILREVAEYAGWVVAVRSGICDITSSARCRKTFIYRDGRERALWSVNRMDLSRDAEEEVFSFVGQTPDAFRDLVCRARTQPFPKVREPLSRLIDSGAHATKPASVHFAQLEQGEAFTAPASAWLQSEDMAQVLRVSDVPPREDPRWKSLVKDVLSRLIALRKTPEPKLFVCQDDGGDFDFFEEVDAHAAVGGHYVNGRDWHSILLVTGASFYDLLPKAAREHILPLEPLGMGQRVPVVGRSSPAKLAAFLSGSLPFSSAGVQLLDGWHGPEPWGAWSRDRRCSFKIAFAAPPAEGFTLVVGCHAAISPTFPRLNYQVHVNGRNLGAGNIDLRSNGRSLKVTIPAEAALGRTFLVEFRFDEVRSPAEQGAAADGRQLGIALKWVQAKPLGIRDRLRRGGGRPPGLSLTGTAVLDGGAPPPRLP